MPARGQCAASMRRAQWLVRSSPADCARRPRHCRSPAARPPASARPWRPPPAPAAAPARRSCSRAAPPARPCRQAATDRAISYIAWCRLGSNFSPSGSNFFTPCFSSTFSSSRSVSSTPSSSALSAGIRLLAQLRVERRSARAMLSATARMSRAKLRCRRRAHPRPRARSAGADSPSRRACAGACPCTRRPPATAPRPGSAILASSGACVRSRLSGSPAASTEGRADRIRHHIVPIAIRIRPGYQGSGAKNQAAMRDPAAAIDVTRRSACSPPWRCSPPSG